MSDLASYLEHSVKKKKIELGLAAWAISSIVIVSVLAATSTPSVYVSVIFAFLTLTLVGVGYLLLRTLRKVGGASARYAAKANKQLSSVEDIARRLGGAVANSEAARARAANKSNEQLNRVNATSLKTVESLANSEAARARAAIKANDQLNGALTAVRGMESLLERVHKSVEAVRSDRKELLGNRADLVESFTSQAVKLDLYLDEMREALSVLVPSHKQSVLDSINSEEE
ncbi:hypothetical protein ACQR35_05085 [Pseudarthrobacter sp. J1738]|uniref:hypothetical protein n=1 Tax=Pseudarthrobacter sp. J1738 TaxID=3420446 RepID=UPI003D28117F